jgi:hypothetical protein
MRAILALGLTSVFVATTCAQVVLGNDKGKVRATNALAQISLSEAPYSGAAATFRTVLTTRASAFGPRTRFR